MTNIISPILTAVIIASVIGATFIVPNLKYMI